MTGVDMVDERYRLLELIGSGGMSRVWRAHDELLQRTVAVKEITVPAGTIREARAAARLDHPGVVKVFDVIQRGEQSWIVMEFIDGRSLQQAAPLPIREVARIGLQVMAALRAAHSAGVLHRDVKPDNVLLADDGRVVLGDFGLATIGREGGPDPRLGSPNFIAPERLSDQEVGVPADLWSFGATLYAAVEGRTPFARGDTEAQLWAVLSAPPHPPRLAGELSGLLLELLDKDPGRRPAAVEVEQRLRAVVSSGSYRGRAQVSAPSVEIPQRRRPRLSMIITGVLLALAIGGAAAASAVNRADPPATVGDSPPATRLSAVPMPSPPGLCGPDPEKVTAATARIPAGLPDGWIWFRDPAGFALALPAGWTRVAAGNNVCFTDPEGRRAFTVNVAAVVTREPLAYWQSREKAEALPGYTRISMGVLLLKRGGADWEYTWRPDSDTVRHERRVLVAVTGDTSYLLRWTVTDKDWPTSVRLQRRLVDLFSSSF
ncbi:putative Ser/Thr protein kinase [Actinoplanes lutulentus]|uniref:non-specific serine/threonine protein kinase n=1 Tax=Actinoplanes lutulentus TaxID=1287878 RepID=A0A327YYK4_9ACTN|nr:serine/threonine-protein kinase [Actinoplanes lutulentus]MBB2943508.1 putative Ser/Thr protein kinase [Actinoplanes lutulentus]RAK25973.1 serine/threonine protein kinase [Actinoplanes lutulentus]